MSYVQITAGLLFILTCFVIFRRVFSLVKEHGSFSNLLNYNSRGFWTVFVSGTVIVLFLSAITATGSNVIIDFFKPGINLKNAGADAAKHKIGLEEIRLLEFYLNRWRALVQAAVVLAGLPIAYMLWHWRDKNVCDKIENERKDILLKEFLEVQLRAAGALDKNLQEAGCEALQIASLHQLRIFLGRKSVGTFQRPALELLLAGHTTAMDEMQTGQLEAIPVGRRVNQLQFAVKDPQPFFEALKTKRVTRERMGILRDEVETLFQSAVKIDGRSAVKLNGRNFDLLVLEIPAADGEIDVSGSSFFGTKLQKSNLSGLDFSECRLQGTDLRGTNWRNATSYKDAYFDNYTQLNDDANAPWSTVNRTEKMRLQSELVQLGAIHRKRTRP